MRCKYCGKRLREGERCSCRSQRSRQMRSPYAEQDPRMMQSQYRNQGQYMNQGQRRSGDPYMYQNPYQAPYPPQSKKAAKAAAKAAKRRRRRRRIKKFLLTVFILVLLGVLGFFGYHWFKENKDTVLSMLPFMQKTTEAEVLEPTGTIMENVGETTAWTDAPVVEESHAEEINRIKEQYEAGRIDYGGVMKNLGRLDMVTMTETDQVSYQNLAAQAAQDLRDMVNEYINTGYYSEAHALLSRLNQTVPGDTVVAELISSYAAQIGL